jgi:hypothetical protein
MNTETEILMGIIFFLAITGFISNYLPDNMKILSTFDFGYLGGSIIGIGAACSIFTGIGCAAALAIFGVSDFLIYFAMPNLATFAFVKSLIITPLVLIIAYIMVRLGRGGG